MDKGLKLLHEAIKNIEEAKKYIESIELDHGFEFFKNLVVKLHELNETEQDK